MKYRTNKRTKDKISEIGMGTAYIGETDYSEAVKTVRYAYENGINYFDLAAGDGSAFGIFGEALFDVRDQVMYQIHFGADYSKGAYGWTLNLDTIKRSVDKQLHDLKTDYIDYGFIHCQDESSDWKKYQKNGVLDYLLGMKEQGVVKHIGASSHTPSVIQEIIDTDLIDMLMFSVNPAYDYNHGDYAYGGVDERADVYKRCEKLGIGISVMKPFSGGQLLSAKTSPFGKALTQYQCIKYALDKPGILTVLPGAQSVEEIEHLLKFYELSEEELDYSIIGSFAPPEANGKCVYCNHCKPCPVGLDIGMINKFYDLAKIGDDMAMEHYRALDNKAGDCIRCGHCNSRCMFGVDQMSRMQEIKDFFEE
ncbi:MAG: aldo/keto reductase [Lachnospiraceae bacterium]|nr:aldo/keto reductase [Lachnospiraceae bacterium]